MTKTSDKSQAKATSVPRSKVNIELHALNVEYVNVAILRPNGYNPNKQDEHEFELLCQSMREDGFTQPVIATMEYMIIDGEHRWRAAQSLGMTEIPVVRIAMNEIQARISTIRHNRARGTHDADLEVLVLKDLEKLGGIALIRKGLLMDEKDIHELLDFTDAPSALAGEQFNNAWLPVNSKNNCNLDDGGNPVNLPAFSQRTSIDNATVITSRTQNANVLAAGRLKQGIVSGGILPYQLVAIFDGESAEKVRHALEDLPIVGETPADKFYNVVIEMEKQNG